MQDIDLIVKSIGERIHKLRKARKLTQEELGKITGTSLMTVKRLETAMASTQIDKVIAIAKGLGINFSDLVAGVEGEPAKDIGYDSQWEQAKQKVESLTEPEREWIGAILINILSNPWKKVDT